jgi:hypothetical protein
LATYHAGGAADVVEARAGVGHARAKSRLVARESHVVVSWVVV